MNGQAPVNYVVSKFASARIVLLGEVHEVRETCKFVASLVEPLDRSGVKVLCSEFVPSRFNDELRRIVTHDEYDEEKVLNIFRRSAWPSWGYREYVDIIKAVWSVNAKRVDGKPPFLIIGIDSDWKQVDLLQSNPQQRFKLVMDREKHMTKSIRDVVKDQATLVHIGFSHTVKHGLRVANELSQEHSKDMFQIVMHHTLQTPGGQSEISKTIEAAIGDSKRKRCGFDIVGSAFAKLRDDKIPFAKALGKDPTFDLLAQGYVFLKPADQLSKVTWIDGFISEQNFADALVIARKGRMIKGPEPGTPDELDALFAAKYRASE